MTSRSHTPEDVEKIQSGWRKQQTNAEKQFDKRVTQINDLVRNETLEEVAKEFDKMPFGDTSASFAIFVRNMKR